MCGSCSKLFDWSAFNSEKRREKSKNAEKEPPEHDRKMQKIERKNGRDSIQKTKAFFDMFRRRTLCSLRMKTKKLGFIEKKTLFHDRNGRDKSALPFFNAFPLFSFLSFSDTPKKKGDAAMKKSLKIFAVIAGLIVIGGTSVYLGRNTLIKKAVETAGPKFLQTTVSLGEVDFQPFQGHLMLKELHIGNPEGFSENDLFSLGLITVDLQPKTLLTNKIIINQILIDKVAARYEIANGTNNIAMLQKNIAGGQKTATEKNIPAEPADLSVEKPVKTVIIKDLSVKNAKVSAAVSGVSMSLPLPTIHMTGIGEEKPSTFKEVTTSIMKVFSTETLNAIADATAQAVKSGVDSIEKILKKLF